MDIIKKLQLSQTPMVFFTEGGFIKLYNQSFFVAKRYFKTSLKPVVRYIQKIDKVVVYGGFPVGSLNQRFPLTVKTDFGYQLNGSWNLSDYHSWFEQITGQQLSNCSKGLTDSVWLKQKPLTQQQLQFILSWQPNQHLPIVESLFLQSLKSHLQSS